VFLAFTSRVDDRGNEVFPFVSIGLVMSRCAANAWRDSSATMDRPCRPDSRICSQRLLPFIDSPYLNVNLICGECELIG
jgi:hypothetical protein